MTEHYFHNARGSAKDLKDQLLRKAPRTDWLLSGPENKTVVCPDLNGILDWTLEELSRDNPVLKLSPEANQTLTQALREVYRDRQDLLLGRALRSFLKAHSPLVGDPQ